MCCQGSTQVRNDERAIPSSIECWHAGNGGRFLHPVIYNVGCNCSTLPTDVDGEVDRFTIASINDRLGFVPTPKALASKHALLNLLNPSFVICKPPHIDAQRILVRCLGKVWG
jgi:hypothetical protein